ncbi:MAG: RNA polymerase sigma-54 factor [Zetaproteobacteria bacterium CG_4_9_14_3_um_filter_49_83]|nr:MAG: RNA polymerase sigma-54 factor [Zetaproteobacteria bacterium CG1_02_49_23]PIQ30367.1 MAG: RNA polymerase sigma-54 factor [Zetaproteobacteria bacterium CG17_big_fil_post_rev_8_21_14_2_50_50_13]PIY54731.1 MAG: RNA polymerase sigma-54 factor [Zetaproteobacteria bacterium CG_4_10_14_0_8_um_filter_49_80]PJA34130.1 MAG: RNA polymerase sigma-54 factor [Zetaproteobacteria bacterium CG_4_9_14_3_um_filter_49_83]
MKNILSQKLGQRMSLTPQLAQSLKILAMNTVDLDAYIETCLEANPLLEVDERSVEADPSEQETNAHDLEASDEWRESGDDRWESMYTQSSSKEPSDMLHQQWQDELSISQSLHEQVNRQPMTDEIRAVAHALIDMLDDDGYLRTSLDEAASDLGCDADALRQTLSGVIHQLDPPGIGARDLTECLLLQLDQDNACDILARQMLLHSTDALLKSDKELAELLDCEAPDIAQARARLRRLDPFPGHGLRGDENIYIQPEIIFRRTAKGDIQIEVPGYNWQGVRLNDQWTSRKWQGADREFIENATREAKWLINALDQRFETLQKVATYLAKRQRAFLKYGMLGLKPLTLQDVAQGVGLHESTISRVTNGKFAQTPLGLIEMRSFFSAGLPTRGGGLISVYRVQLRIKSLVAAESAEAPMSDQALAEHLCSEGIEIARRTVAKYRESLGIAPALQRLKSADAE